MRPARVLIVDDSALMRHRLARHLEADLLITVVGCAHDGLDALDQIPVLKPDVVTLDVEMPHMDGLATLKRIMADCPTPVVMLSAFTQRGARATIQALMRGAVDFVPKPADSGDLERILDDLVVRIKIAAQTSVSRHLPPVAGSSTAQLPSKPKARPRPFRGGDPLVVIGASTGGPRALQHILSHLPAGFPASLAVVQHMPTGFTSALAQRLDEGSPLTVHEAADGDRLGCGLVLLAPGGSHLRFEHRRVSLDQGPRRNGVRPCLDIAMESAVEHHGLSVIGVVLTGMGSDGTVGAQRIKDAGGRVVVEDESTSIVYGMPRSVVEAGLADRVVPLPEVAPTLVELLE